MDSVATADRRQNIVTDPVRVMVVDDSVVARGLMTRWVDEDPELAVIASHRNGKLAVADVMRSEPDVIILDIEMPEMDGLTALPLLLKARPGVQIVMASTLTRRNAEISLKALSLGASDYIPKPDGNSSMTTSSDFRRDLVEKVRALGRRCQRRRLPSAPREAVAAHPVARAAVSPSLAGEAVPARRTAASGSFKLRNWSSVMPKALAIGSSTGGPQALAKVMQTLGPGLKGVPVFITQHMPATFTAILAEHLSKASGLVAAEGVDGESVTAGRIYVAPGGKHMLVRKGATGPVIRLSDEPPVNFCKPAVDAMFQSIAEVYGPSVLSAILTGMGSDGARGAVAVADHGGSVVAQDEETSVVWGMPQAAANSGACAAVLPLDELAATLGRVLKGGRP